MNLYRYAVGEPFPVPEGFAPPEGGQWGACINQLVLWLPGPSAGEIRAVQNGTAQFGLYVDGPALFLLYDFAEGVITGEAPYSWHLVNQADPSQATPPAALETPTSRYLLEVILADSSDLVVKVIRGVSFSPEFSHALHAALTAQIASPWPGTEAYNRHLADVYRRFPDTPSMLKEASARCVGGRG